MSLLSYGFLDQSICVLKQRATVPHLSCVTTTLFGLGWGLSKSYHSSPWHRVVSIISTIPVVCPRWDPSVEGQHPGLHRHADSDGWQPSVEWTRPSMLQSKGKKRMFFPTVRKISSWKFMKTMNSNFFASIFNGKKKCTYSKPSAGPSTWGLFFWQSITFRRQQGPSFHLMTLKSFCALFQWSPNLCHSGFALVTSRCLDGWKKNPSHQ